MDVAWELPPPAVLPPVLRPYVATMHGYAASGLTPGVHRGLPSGTIAMIVSLDAPLETAPSAEAWAAGERDSQWLTLGGLHTRAAMVTQPGRWAGVQVALHPLGVRHLFGWPASALPTDTFDAHDLDGSEVDRLVQELHAATDWPGRYAAVTRFLLRRQERAEARIPVRPEVVEAWRRLADAAGTARVDQLASAVGYSRRRLTQLFVDEVGHGPKTVARLFRFDAARQGVVARASAPGSLDLAGLAAHHGYYDHAHLVREFRDFTGLSPTAWLAEEFPNVQASLPRGEAG